MLGIVKCDRNRLKANSIYLSEWLSKQKGQKIRHVDAMHEPAYSLYSEIFSKESQLCLKVASSFSLNNQNYTLNTQLLLVINHPEHLVLFLPMTLILNNCVLLYAITFAAFPYLYFNLWDGRHKPPSSKANPTHIPDVTKGYKKSQPLLSSCEP